MKKITRFLRSMKFGLILLVLVMICSLIGSLIPQASEGVDYTERFGESWGSLLVRLGFTDIFHSWYFYVLLGFLCVNLIFCSILRFPRIRGAMGLLKKQAAEAECVQTCTPEERQKMEEILRFHHFHTEERNGRRLFYHNGIGFYGSFLTHISILLVLIFGGLTLLTPQITDYTLMPGESLSLDGGVSLRCDAFQIQDEDGRLDYTTKLHAENEQGMSKDQEIRVNEPMRFGNYKIYQQSYGTAGQLTLRSLENGAEDKVYLTDKVRLFLDSQNGVQFNALYPGYFQTEDGNYTLVTSTSGSYEDPVYDLLVAIEGQYTPVLAFPGDELTIQNVVFCFEEPVEYPGLRVKKLSTVLFVGLYTGFGLMVAALFLCFFTIPVCVAFENETYTVKSPKDASALIAELESVKKPEANDSEASV